MALSSTIEWEVRTAGSDTNGGGFNTSSSGTDYSQQNSFQLNPTDLTTIAAGGNTITSLAGGFTAAMVGNLIHINSGTNFTTGFYEIVSFTNTNTVTLDRSPTPLAAGLLGNGKIGGGLLSLGGTLGAPVTGNVIWIKFGTYSIAHASANVSGGRFTSTQGSASTPIIIRGYDTTHGDKTSNRPTLQTGISSINVGIIGFTSTGSGSIENLIIDGNVSSFSGSVGITASATPIQLRTVTIKNCDSAAITMTTSGLINIIDSEFTGCKTTSTINITSTNGTVYLCGCSIHDNTINGLEHSGSGGKVIVDKCIFSTNKNSTSFNHIIFDSTAILMASNCTFYNSGADGISLATQTNSSFINCIFESNGGYGVGTPAAGEYSEIYFYNNAFFNNTTAKYDTTKIDTSQVIGEVINTTGTFFNNAGSNDFSLNTLTGQGLLALEAGFQPTFSGLSTLSYFDIGAAQHNIGPNVYNVME